MVMAAAALSFSAAYAQEPEQAPANDAAQTEAVAEVAEAEVVTEEPAGEPMHFALMKKFLEGGWGWMLPVLVCLILGLAISIERILYMTFAQINTKKFVAEVEETLNSKGVEAAKELCRNTRGPIASIYYQGLMRYDQGLEAVEKAVVSYGSVQQGQMESG